MILRYDPQTLIRHQYLLRDPFQCLHVLYPDRKFYIYVHTKCLQIFQDSARGISQDENS